jgi:1,4-dihydroxy-2-naphthoyl-CoA hydrolase
VTLALRGVPFTRADRLNMKALCLGYRGGPMVSPTAEQINEAMVGFDKLYGLQMLECGAELARAQIEVRDELKQPAGLLHGGVLASIAESLASLATAVAVLPEGLVAMGQSNNTSFLRPITQGVVHAQATRLHKGRSSWVWDVRFSDADGRLCAVTRMTIAVRPLPSA